MIALVLVTAVLAAVLALALYGDAPCGHRDEECAWECGLYRGHLGEHGLWLKDERGYYVFGR